MEGLVIRVGVYREVLAQLREDLMQLDTWDKNLKQRMIDEIDQVFFCEGPPVFDGSEGGENITHQCEEYDPGN